MSNKSVAGILAIPDVGEAFELTLAGDTDSETRTQKFKLVQFVNSEMHWEELVCKLEAEGPIPEGRWMEAFRIKYPQADGNGPIGITDSSGSWHDPKHPNFFPHDYDEGLPWSPSLVWADAPFNDDWRWIVGVNENIAT